MRITPLDVRKQEFRRAVRGFDCDEVRAFLNTLADEYETVLIDNKQLRERVMDQEEKIGEYKHLERTLRDTLMTAERLTQDTRERANKEGDLIIQDARLQAKRILEECRIRTEELRGELTGLRKEKETYLARFKTLAETQIQFVESHRTDFDDLDKRLVGMVDEVIEGLGAKAAASAEAAVEDVETAARTAPETTAAPPSADIQPDNTPQTESVPYEARDEVDRWREYQTESTGLEAKSAPEIAPLKETAPAAEHVETPRMEEVPVAPPSPTVAAPEQAWPAATLDEHVAPVPEAIPEPAQQETVRPEVMVAPTPPPAPAQVNPWQGGNWNGVTEQPVAATTAPGSHVELATMGIPVPLAPRSDGTDAAMAVLTEDEKPEPAPVW